MDLHLETRSFLGSIHDFEMSHGIDTTHKKRSQFQVVHLKRWETFWITRFMLGNKMETEWKQNGVGIHTYGYKTSLAYQKKV